MFAKSDQRSDAEAFEWPEQLGNRFLLTVDTEEEFDWNAPFERSGHTTITVPMLERFQQFVEKYGIKPTYFVDYSIVEDDEAIAFLQSIKKTGNADIGVHLHPWVNPPFDEETSDYNSFAGNLPLETEEAKIVALRKAIEDRIGITSPIYRAGRYGVGPNTIAILKKLGFTIDSSVRARFDYSSEGGPDFRSLGPEPIWLDEAKSLLEVPLTTVFSGLLRQLFSPLSAMMNKSSIANTIISGTKMLERIPLTPEGITAWEAKEAIDVALDDHLKLLVFSFHSPSLSPGHTPYVKTEEDLNRFYDWWRDIIEHLKVRNVKPISMSELSKAANLG